MSLNSNLYLLAAQHFENLGKVEFGMMTEEIPKATLQRWLTDDAGRIAKYGLLAAGGVLLTWKAVRWFKRKEVKKGMPNLPVRPDPHGYKHESVIAGSPLLENGKIPPCQVKIAFIEDGSYRVVGSGVRVENYLICPQHNLVFGKDIYLINGHGSGQVMRPLEDPEEISLAPDAVAILVPEATWAALRVKQATLGPLASEATVSITSGLDGKYSVGSLKVDGDFGRVIYKASTQQGFSGSAYMNGNVAIGMHFHGGINAGGYELLYLYARLKLARMMLDESSEDFLLKEMSKTNFRKMEVNDDFCVVRMATGRFHITKRDVLDKYEMLKEKQKHEKLTWVDESDLDVLEDYVNRYEPECLPVGFQGESPRPAVRAPSGPVVSNVRPASESLIEGQLQQLTKLVESMRASQNSLQQQLKALRTQKSEPVTLPPQPTTSPQTPAPGPSGVRSSRSSRQRQVIAKLREQLAKQKSDSQ